MLSQREIDRINKQLEEKPKGKYARTLRKKLTEHELATNLPPFTPLTHERIYINRFTSNEVLENIIDEAKAAIAFTIDTESVIVYREKNSPALIQIQILSPTTTNSTVILIEVKHLPTSSSNQYEQIRRLCRIVLESNKPIFIWGEINELDDFIPFQLFTAEQINKSNSRNLQSEFQDFWRLHFPHQLESNCQCEGCMKKNRGDKWALQTAVATLLHEWLDKRFSRSAFDMGLDSNIEQPTNALRRKQEVLSRYAANDCLAMQKLILAMNQKDQIRTSDHTSQSPERNEKKQVESPPFSHESANQIVSSIITNDELRQVDSPTRSIDQSPHRVVTINRSTTAIGHEVSNERISITIRSAIPMNSTNDAQSMDQRSYPRRPTTSPWDQTESLYDPSNKPTTFRSNRIVIIRPEHRLFDNEKFTSIDRFDSTEQHENTNKRVKYDNTNDQLDQTVRNENGNDLQDSSNRAREDEYNDHINDQNNKFHRIDKKVQYASTDRMEQQLAIELNNRMTSDDSNERRIFIETNNQPTLVEGHKQSRTSNYQTPAFDVEQARRRRNRLSTIKQRIRHYRTEIIRRGIDPRFRITHVKETLRHYQIPFTALNIARSKLTGRKSLYIGIRRTSNLRKQERSTRRLFTKEAFEKLKARNRRLMKRRFQVN